mgnify:CR=1 FL=1
MLWNAENVEPDMVMNNARSLSWGGGVEGVFPCGPVDPFVVREDLTGHGAAEAMLDNYCVMLHNKR